MSMTIGRCTLADDPHGVSRRWRGDDVSFTVDIDGVGDADAMAAKIQQLRGLMGNDDEDVFPLTWSEDPTLDGFYRGFEVEVQGTAVDLATGVCTSNVRARRVGGFGAPEFEVVATSTTMTNSHGLAAAQRVAIPATGFIGASEPLEVTTAPSGGFSWLAANAYTTDDGSVYWVNTAVGSPFRWTWSGSPAGFYVGSTRFEALYGATYYPVVGKQIPLLGANAQDWRISNGLVRVSITTAARIEVQHYDGSAWDTVKSWSMSASPSGVKGVTILRNSPNQVVVRVSLSGALLERRTLDISLRRGMRWAAFYHRWEYGSPQLIKPTTVEAGTAITGGLGATATDASGNRYVVASPMAHAATGASGQLAQSGVPVAMAFMIGSQVGADGSAAAQVAQYIAAISEEQRVIAR